MATSDISHVISQHIPNIDQYLSEYIVAVLTAETFNSPDEIQEAIGEVLGSCIDDVLSKGSKTSSEKDVDKICLKLYNLLNINGDEGEIDLNDDEKLLQPVQLGTMASDFEMKEDAWKSIWTSGKEVESKVDAKKLQKAEDKLKQKAEKRDQNGPAEVVAPVLSIEATASQVFSKKIMKQEASGVNRTKDIKIENFDVAFGNHVLLQGAELNLSMFKYTLKCIEIMLTRFNLRFRTTIWFVWS